MLKIRLARHGRKATPFYRIVVVDSRKKRNGSYLELIGTFNPLSKDVKIDVDLYGKYVGVGAQPTEIVEKLYNNYVKKS